MERQFKPSKADLTILDHIEKEPDTTQASLAERLGVAVGTINWHLKRLIEKGYVKEWNGELQISSGKYGKLEVLSD